MNSEIEHIKKELRRSMLIKRKQIVLEQANPPMSLPDILLKKFDKDFWRHKVVSMFYPIGSEISSLGLLSILIELDVSICLPVVEKDNAPLIFRAYQLGDELQLEKFGTRSPYPDKIKMIPDIMFVPFLAFDEKKFRLGYGGGFYDRTIENLSKNFMTIGLGWDAQKIDKLPIDAFDKPLDYILTERIIYS
ncbi:MAG: 5-formyltetrahydrofolate cyclo-ligase [Alphaproteobacteria bacterium]